MTLRTRPTRPTSRVTRFRKLFDDEDRQQAVVSAAFIVAIIAIVVLLLAAIGIAYYNDNLRPLARVGSTEVGPQLLRDRVELEAWRIQRESNRLTQASINGDIDEATRARRAAALEQRQENLSTTSLEDLIDLLYQSSLAAEEGIAVTAADIDAAMAKEFNDIEKRHVWAIIIKPGEGKAAEDITNADRQAAIGLAEEALEALAAGTPFDEVAREYSTDATKLNGGDLGVVTELALEEEWSAELFELPLEGTTGIIRGADGTFRIGRVKSSRQASRSAFTPSSTSPLPTPSYAISLARRLLCSASRTRSPTPPWPKPPSRPRSQFSTSRAPSVRTSSSRKARSTTARSSSHPTTTSSGRPIYRPTTRRGKQRAWRRRRHMTSFWR